MLEKKNCLNFWLKFFFVKKKILSNIGRLIYQNIENIYTKILKTLFKKYKRMLQELKRAVLVWVFQFFGYLGLGLGIL